MSFYLNSRPIMKTTIIEPENKLHLVDSNLFKNIGFQRRQKHYKGLFCTHKYTVMRLASGQLQSLPKIQPGLYTHTCKHTPIILQLEK